MAFWGARKVVALGKDDAAMEAGLLGLAALTGSGELGLVKSVSVRDGALRFLGGWVHVNVGLPCI